MSLSLAQRLVLVAWAKHWLREDLQHISSVSVGLNELSKLYTDTPAPLSYYKGEFLIWERSEHSIQLIQAIQKQARQQKH